MHLTVVICGTRARCSAVYVYGIPSSRSYYVRVRLERIRDLFCINHVGDLLWLSMDTCSMGVRSGPTVESFPSYFVENSECGASIWSKGKMSCTSVERIRSYVKCIWVDNSLAHPFGSDHLLMYACHSHKCMQCLSTCTI